MKVTLIIICIAFASCVFAQSKDYPKTILNFETQFDTLRQVGYPYTFGSHNVSEYGNNISNGSLIFPKAKVGVVTKCTYETFFENDLVTRISLTTESKKSTKELKELAERICPEINDADVSISFTKDVILSDKLCSVSYTEHKRSKKAELEIVLVDEVLN